MSCQHLIDTFNTLLGPHCEYRVPACESSPCQNNGKCTESHGHRVEIVCSCPGGWTGFWCELQVDECLSSPCIHGNCTDLINGFRCRCKSGWSGATCDTDTVCTSIGGPCWQNTTRPDGCFRFEKPMDDDYGCLCQPGYNGKNCESEIDECLSNPCHHNAPCIDGVANVTCVCSNETYGALCQYASIVQRQVLCMVLDGVLGLGSGCQDWYIISALVGFFVIIVMVIGCIISTVKSARDASRYRKRQGQLSSYSSERSLDTIAANESSLLGLSPPHSQSLNDAALQMAIIQKLVSEKIPDNDVPLLMTPGEAAVSRKNRLRSGNEPVAAAAAGAGAAAASCRDARADTAVTVPASQNGSTASPASPAIRSPPQKPQLPTTKRSRAAEAATKLARMFSKSPTAVPGKVKPAPQSVLGRTAASSAAGAASVKKPAPQLGRTKRLSAPSDRRGSSSASSAARSRRASEPPPGAAAAAVSRSRSPQPAPAGVAALKVPSEETKAPETAESWATAAETTAVPTTAAIPLVTVQPASVPNQPLTGAICTERTATRDFEKCVEGGKTNQDAVKSPLDGTVLKSRRETTASTKLSDHAVLHDAERSEAAKSKAKHGSVGTGGTGNRLQGVKAKVVKKVGKSASTSAVGRRYKMPSEKTGSAAKSAFGKRAATLAALGRAAVATTKATGSTSVKHKQGGQSPASAGKNYSTDGGGSARPRTGLQLIRTPLLRQKPQLTAMQSSKSPTAKGSPSPPPLPTQPRQPLSSPSPLQGSKQATPAHVVGTTATTYATGKATSTARGRLPGSQQAKDHPKPT